MPSSIPASLDSESSVPDVEYQDPFFSNAKDVPRKAREYGGQVWLIGTKKHEKPQSRLQPRALIEPEVGRRRRKKHVRLEGPWELNAFAPTQGQVSDWLAEERRPEENRRKKVFASQVRP